MAERLHTGEHIRSGIVGYDVLSEETAAGNVILRSQVTGTVMVVHVDTDYVTSAPVVEPLCNCGTGPNTPLSLHASTCSQRIARAPILPKSLEQAEHVG